MDAWLELPENKKRFEKYKRDPTGTTGTFKDRLKDLAVERLYEKLGYDKFLAFTQKNRKKFDKPSKQRIKDGKGYKEVFYKAGDLMPFHDARQGQSPKMPLNEATLCSEESFALKAKGETLKYLAKIIPLEFGEKPKNKFAEEFFKHVSRAYKNSSSSS